MGDDYGLICDFFSMRYIVKDFLFLGGGGVLTLLCHWELFS